MIKTGCEFKKPFGKALFGTEKTTYYAYPREKLIAEPIFPYFVFDGGAFNFASDRLGTANGDDLLELTMSGKLFDVFTYEGKFNWERSFTYTGDSDFDKKYEWQIWPQRLYMTIPLAHAFLRTGDRRYSDKWLEIVRAWDEAHPYQEYNSGVNYLKTDMVWRDMQVAWRTLSLMHGMFMLADAPFDIGTWNYLYKFLALHARHLHKEALDRLGRGLKQNHVLQIGVALIMAGAMYPEFEGAEDYIKAGRDTVEMNMKGAIYPDGGSNEDSPSYSHFIVRLYLEAYLLLKNNGIDGIAGMRESIIKQYEWLYQCMTPSGLAPRLSDSYALNASDDIRRADGLIGLDFPRVKKSVLFPDSRVAVMRSGPFTLIADAMEHLGGHQHYGRPQTLLFYEKEPILVDSGCCNYDIWDFYIYVRSTEAHNVVYCPDFTYENCKITPRIISYNELKREIILSCSVSCGERAYTWERTLRLGDDGIVIEDHASSDKPLKWFANFHLPRRDIRVYRDKNTVRQLSDRFIMVLTTSMTLDVAFTPVMNDDNRIDFSSCVKVSAEGKDFALTTSITFEKRLDNSHH